MSENRLDMSEKLSEEHREQRDSARVERDSALQERDSARIERDDFHQQTVSMEGNRIAQEQFVVTLSHDLRNPIGAIKMAVDIIRGQADENTLKEMTDLIDRNADQAGELIGHLLDVHLIRSGCKLPIEMRDCDLLPVLQKCQQALAPAERNKVFISSDQVEIKGFWDLRALERAFKNLIGNAIKFSDPEKNIIIHVSQGLDISTISFKNFGQVISLENQLRIFDSQIRIQQTGSQQKKGWGLGLTLVRGIAEAHGGKIEVTSTRHEGTIFTLRIPNDIRTEI